MRKILRTLVICFTMLCLNAPAFAYDFSKYTLPEITPSTQDEIVLDANNFMRLCYELPEGGGDYFTNTVDKVDATNNITVINLQVQTDYNVSDVDGLNYKYPIIYYEKTGGGPGHDQQFLGQTKDGFTITNVRFPMVASWSFLEDLEWVPYTETDGRYWWWEQYNNSLPTNYPVNEEASNNPNFAAELNKAIGIAVIPQTRQWGGNEYFQSRVWAINGAPSKVGQPRSSDDFDYRRATEFPWHKYVNILMPPTYNTWGYGIGFYKYGGSYSYKSFPIAPLKAEVPTPPIVDLTPTPDTQISTGDFELSEKRISKLFDCSDISDTLKSFTFSYDKSDPAEHKTGSSPYISTCEINTVFNAGTEDEYRASNAYKYVIKNTSVLKTSLIGTVGSFASNFYSTNIKTGTAFFDGGSGTVTPNLSYVIWRGDDKPTLASYKESSEHPLISLGLGIGKVPQNERNTAGGYTDTAEFSLRQDKVSVK